MLSKNKIKHIRSLGQKKFRDLHQQFIAEGSKIVLEFLHSNLTVVEMYATKDWLNQNKTDTDTVAITEVTDEELKKITQLSSSQNVLGVFSMPSNSLNKDIFSLKLNLVMDDIRDPGNLGTIIRIADWFGIEQVICSSDSVDLFNPKVVQGTMGSLARVKVVYTDLFDLFKNLPEGIPVYGALLDGENIYHSQLESTGILLIGNEAHGISEKLLPFINKKISIPPFNPNTLKAESLNAAVATGIICAEFGRRNV